ncbi:phosphoglycerate dehydrogenase [Powellomyces hirtus]|uniref:phosphoglycerate dehydrogenase n=1 Tax=Powellomyces hirtus TaxID=109895 RepID=A0A507DTZ0_9FUNG|nr:phosphoglycerate dehydrogenase [Powellomyces hirtus]
MTTTSPARQPVKAGPPKALKPFNNGEIKILLLEGVNATGIKILENAGYQIEAHAKALSPEVLKEKIKDVHAIGLRSKTQLTAEILAEAKKLLVIGCFCIGTNQVDLEYAAAHGIAVFNSPFSNSRSVAELMICEIIALSRQLGDRTTELHQGTWNKTSKNCNEIRGKTLGIVGYGHIGAQLSVIADAMGMVVIFYDVQQIMPLGLAKPVDTLDELLAQADYVSLHVPETDETKNMIGEREVNLMKKGAYLLQASRGTVVDIPAVAAALRSGQLGGAAIDVYPVEPFANGPNFESELRGCPNTILTPHIGGSTEEAQSSIGVEVASALVRYVNNGTTLGAVNFPECDIRSPSADSKTVRLLNTHHNVPGVLKQINKVLSDFNIEKQIVDSRGPIAYLMADINVEHPEDYQKIYERIEALASNIRTRLLY